MQSELPHVRIERVKEFKFHEILRPVTIERNERDYGNLVEVRGEGALKPCTYTHSLRACHFIMHGRGLWEGLMGGAYSCNDVMDCVYQNSVQLILLD